MLTIFTHLTNIYCDYEPGIVITEKAALKNNLNLCPSGGLHSLKHGAFSFKANSNHNNYPAYCLFIIGWALT